MYDFLSKKIVNKLVTNNFINPEEATTYKYCFVLLISTIVSISSIFLISIISGNLFHSCLILISFLICRMCCGGYHAKHHFTCYLITISNHIACLLLFSCFCKYFKYDFLHYFNAFSFILLFLFSPIENKNNPLSINQKKAHKFQCKIIATIILLVSFMPICNTNYQLIVYSFSIGIFSASFSVFLSLLNIFIKKQC